MTEQPNQTRMEERILFVDDDENVLEAYQRKFQHVLKVRTALGPHAGLRELQEKGPFAVVVADMNMPHMNGIEFLKEVQACAPDTVRMMLTGAADLNVVMNAVNDGNVFRFLKKPCPSKQMADALLAGIRQYRLIRTEKELLEGTLNGAVELIAEILSWVNPDAFGRTLHVRTIARHLATRLKVPDAWEIDIAALLSQIGCVAIPPDLMEKLTGDEPLDEDERQLLHNIPAIGQELLEHIPRLENVARIVLYQDKQFDGAGFPENDLSGKDIPLGARILKVALDLMKLRASGLNRAEAINEMQRRRGWYDPNVLHAAIGVDSDLDLFDASWRTVEMPFKELRKGWALASDIKTVDGRKLVVSGTVLTEALLVRLKRFAELERLAEPIEVKIHTKED